MSMQSEKTFRTSSMTLPDRAARGLAWFSIGLGVTEILFPGLIARTLGLDDKKPLLRAYGVREIVTGVAALQPNPIPAIWSRVGGDVLDLATLATAQKDENGQRRNAATALAAVAAITVVDVLVAAALTKQNSRAATGRDFSDRSGFPNGLAAARGAVNGYRAPADMRAAPRGFEQAQQPL